MLDHKLIEICRREFAEQVRETFRRKDVASALGELLGEGPRDTATSNHHRHPFALAAGRTETVGEFLCNSAHEAGRSTTPSGRRHRQRAFLFPFDAGACVARTPPHSSGKR